MSSGTVPVFPINAISYVVDRSITNPGDALKHLLAFENTVEAIPVVQWVAGPTTIYRLSHDSLGDGDNQLHKFSLGPLEISISYDPVTKTIVLQIFFTIPVIGTVSVGEVSGPLNDGVSVKVAFGSFLGGEVGAKLRDDHGYLFYDVTALGKHLQGEVEIF